SACAPVSGQPGMSAAFAEIKTQISPISADRRLRKSVKSAFRFLICDVPKITLELPSKCAQPERRPGEMHCKRAACLSILMFIITWLCTFPCPYPVENMQTEKKMCSRAALRYGHVILVIHLGNHSARSWSRRACQS